MLRNLHPLSSLRERILYHLFHLYGETHQARALEELELQLVRTMGLADDTVSPGLSRNEWSQRDAVLITYGDSIVRDGVPPLQGFDDFLERYCGDAFNSVHILPFFPYSSDDGFSVIDYLEVNPSLGEWRDVEAIADRYRLMADLVINHCSCRSRWFTNFIRGDGEGCDYFLTANPEDDLSLVVRPRTTPLLRNTETSAGEQLVWCTFSHDQVDFDYKNPKVLLAFASIIRFYLEKGVRLFRLDAVAFLWKESGSFCINLPQTHEVIRLLRCLIEHRCPDAVVITETNIPTEENLSYFGRSGEVGEANWVYNFPLPPLLLNSLVTGSSYHLRRWMMRMPPARNGTAYFNFIASHDGIGLRPVEGILSDEETDLLVQTMRKFGGRISWRNGAGETRMAYEINISLFDGLQGTVQGRDDLGTARFLCAHTIMLALEGIPGIYIHSLLATGNDYDLQKKTGQLRSINRHRWDAKGLEQLLDDPQSVNRKVLDSLLGLLRLRKNQDALHPNATQFTLNLGDDFFGIWRQSMDREQSIFAVTNVTAQTKKLDLGLINIIHYQQWYDLLSDLKLQSSDTFLELAAYQSVWLTNK